jgi:predicted transcriptional regulator YdeE
MSIAENQTLHVKNLISLRRNLTQAELQIYGKKLNDYITENGAEKAGLPISATYAADAATGKMDIELYVPINRELPSNGNFVFKPELYLANCVKITHKGNPQSLQNSINELNQYIAERKLTPISVGFSVNRVEIVRQEDMDKFEVDIYVSVSPNIL